VAASIQASTLTLFVAMKTFKPAQITEQQRLSMNGTVWNGDTSVVQRQEPQVEPVKTLLPALKKEIVGITRMLP
jgi:hypothetical protein